MKTGSNNEANSPLASDVVESQATRELSAAPAFTSGPWFWKVDLNSKQISLQSEGNMRQYVMDFARWGAGGAPRFFEGGLMHRGDRFAAIVEGREHHASWFQSLDHPDARLIAAAPALYAALKEARELIRIWHGFEGELDPIWKIYDTQSPEMKRINAALALVDGQAT